MFFLKTSNLSHLTLLLYCAKFFKDGIMAQKEIYNFEISDQNFDDLVITNSHKLPVFVLFLSPISSTCIAMENRLIDYAEEFAGQFILARLDIDMYQDAREKFGVENVPMLRAYQNGEVVAQEVGGMTEEALEILFKQFDIFNPSEELRKEALLHHQQGNTPEAVKLLTKAIQLNPTNIKAGMSMCQIFLDLDMLAEAAELFTKLPDNIKESDEARYLIGQITIKKLALDTEGMQTITQKLESDPENEDLRFDLAVCKLALQDYAGGVKELFDMLMKNPNAKGGGAKEMAIAMMNLVELNDTELAGQLRKKMAMVVN